MIQYELLMILRNQFLLKWEWKYIFDHIDDKNKFIIDKLIIKNSEEFKFLINQENNDQVRNEKID